MILKTKIMETIIEMISLLFILLLVYAAVTKLLVYEQFRVQIGQSSMISPFADWIAWRTKRYKKLEKEIYCAINKETPKTFTRVGII